MPDLSQIVVVDGRKARGDKMIGKGKTRSLSTLTIAQFLPAVVAVD